MLQHKSYTFCTEKSGVWLLEENYCSSTIDLNVRNPWSNSPITPLEFLDFDLGICWKHLMVNCCNHRVIKSGMVQRFGRHSSGLVTEIMGFSNINGWRFRPKKTRLLKGPAISPQVKSIMGQPTYALAPPKLKIMEIIDTVQSKLIRKKTTGIVVESRFQQNPIYK